MLTKQELTKALGGRREGGQRAGRPWGGFRAGPGGRKSQRGACSTPVSPLPPARPRTFPLLCSHPTARSGTSPCSQTDTVPTEHSLPAPGVCHPTFCLYEFDDSRDLMWVGSHSVPFLLLQPCIPSCPSPSLWSPAQTLREQGPQPLLQLGSCSEKGGHVLLPAVSARGRLVSEGAPFSGEFPETGFI